MSQTDQTVCKRCQRHGQDADKKLALHRDWWRQQDAELREAHKRESEGWRAAADALEAKLVERDRRLSDMRAVAVRGYEQTPLGGIKAWLQDGIVVAAEEKMRAAYRARGKALGVIWRIDRLHHEAARREMCSCGRPVSKCREFQALAPVLEALDAWEKRQLELLKKDGKHELPHDHPEVVKRTSRGRVKKQTANRPRSGAPCTGARSAEHPPLRFG